MNDEIAHEVLTAALSQDLKRDFPNAKLGLKPPFKAANPTSRDRIDKTIEELNALVGDLNTLIATLGAIKDRL